MVINDGSGNPAHIAADLLSQAEHDELASSILITTDRGFGEKVAAEVERQLALLSRESIARASWDKFGAVIVAGSIEEAAAFSNRIAPEHLELAVADPFGLLPLIDNAGAIFMGHWTPEAAGDYLAGPNHTLPTGGTARFFSPLSVDDFVKKSSIISFSEQGLKRLGNRIVQIAGLEGLEAHARSVSLRLEEKPMNPLRSSIANMAGYVPGFQPPDIASWIKLNTNENPYPPSPKVKEAILAEVGDDAALLRTYPSASSEKLRQAAAELYGFDTSWIIMANGSDEVLNNLIRACAGEGEEIAYVHPSYSYYATLAEIQGAKVRTFGLS